LIVSAGVNTFTDAIDANGGANISGGAGLVASSAKISDLTSGRVVVAGTDGELEDASTFTVSGGTVSATAFSATNLTGTLQTAAQPNVTSLGTIANLVASRAQVTGVGGLVITGVSTFTGAVDANGGADISGGVGLNVVGHAELDEVNVSGVSTYAGAIDANAGAHISGGIGLEVVGHTEVDNFSASGVSTFAALVDGNAGANFSGAETVLSSATVSDLTENRIVIAGASGALEDASTLTFDGTKVQVGSAITMYQATGIVSATYYYGDGSNLLNAGSTLSAASAVQRVVTTSLTSGTMTTAGTDADLTFDTSSNTLNAGKVNVAGVGTFGGLIDGNAGATITGAETTLSSATVSDLTNNRVVIAGASGALEDSGNLTFDGTTLTVTGNASVTTDLNVDGGADISGGVGLNVVGHTELDEINVSGVSTFTGAVDANGGADISGGVGLNVNGHTELDNVNVSGAITATTFTGNLDGTVNTAAQGSITSLGTLTGLTVSGTSALGVVNITGSSTFTGSVLDFADSKQLRFGTGNDFEVFFNGTDQYLKSKAGKIRIEVVDGDAAITCNPNGSVEIFHDANKKLETTFTGAIVTGILTATTFSGSGASLDTLNASELDSGTIPSARYGTGNTFVKLRSASAASDSGTNTFAGNGSGAALDGSSGDHNTFYGRSAGGANDTGSNNAFYGSNAGVSNVTGSNLVCVGYQADATNTSTSNEVTLGNDSITKFRVPGIGLTFTSSGIGILTATQHFSGDIAGVGATFTNVTGTLQTAAQTNITSVGTLGGLTITGGNLVITDSSKITMGSGNVLQMNHFGGNTFLEHTSASGAFYIQGDDLRLTNKDRDETYIECDDEAGVQINYTNSKKFETTHSGAIVTGILTATSFTGTLNTAAQTNITSVGTLGALHIASNGYQALKVDNTDDGANGAYIELFNDSSSPADDDVNGVVAFRGNNSADEETTYAQIRSTAIDVTDGTEDGNITFHTRAAGAFGERVRIRSGGEFAIGGSGYASQPFSVQTSGTNLGYMQSTGTTRAVMNFVDANSTVNVGYGAIGDSHVFMKDSTEKLRIDSSGRILKGLTTARGNYGNNTSGVEYGVQVEGLNAINSTLALVRNSNDANDGGIVLGKTRATSVGGNTVVQAGDDLGTIAWAGSDGTSLQFGAELLAEVQTGVGNDDLPTDLIFKTNAGGTSTGERLRITSAGNVTTSGESTFDRTTAGFTARNGDCVSITRAGGTPLELTRTSSQGNMINFFDTDGATQRANIGLTGNDLIFGLTAEKVRITSDGEVLTGHDTVLNVGGAVTQEQLVGTNFATSGSALFRFDAGSSGPTLSFAHSKNGTKGTQTIVADGDELGKLRFYGSDGTDFNNYGAEIRALCDGTPGSDDMPGALTFGTTADGAAAPTERIRITKEGYVQIKYQDSATTPNAPLYVGVAGKSSITYGGGSADTACVRIEDEGSSDGYYHGLELRTKRSGDVRLYAQDMGDNIADFVIATDNGTDTPEISEEFRIKADGTADFNSNTVQKAVLKNYTETIKAIGNTGTSTTLDLADGNVFTATLNGNCTFTFTTGTNSAPNMQSFSLLLSNDSSAGRTITWPAAVKWPNNSIPSRTTTASKTDIWSFMSPDNGTTWYGNIALYNFT